MVMIVCTDSIAAYRDSLSERGLSPNTIRAYVTDARLLWSEWVKIEATPLQTMESLTAQWLNNGRKEWGPRTTMRKVTSVKSYLTWLGISDPLAKYRTPTAEQPEPHPLPDGLEDLEKLITVSYTPDHVILVTLCGLVGLRISEALSIEDDDFNLRDRTLTVRGKGDRSRCVPLSPRAYDLLINRIAERFLQGGGKLITFSDAAARKTITLLGKRAGISRSIASHDLRATFATMAYARSKDIAAVSRLLGHANVQTTMLYIGTNRERLRDAASFAEED
jgi:integrase